MFNLYFSSYRSQLGHFGCLVVCVPELASVDYGNFVWSGCVVLVDFSNIFDYSLL